MKVDDYGTGDFVRRAQKYVAASNEHDVAAIEDMLTLECEYISSGVGNHNGREVILGMMQGFFERFPDVRWQPSNFLASGERVVSFDFIITRDGNSLTGKEKLFFNDQGKISRIEVAR